MMSCNKTVYKSFNSPNPNGVKVICASPQLLDGVLSGVAELVEAGAEVSDVVLEVVHLQLERVLLEGLVRHVQVIRPILK